MGTPRSQLAVLTYLPLVRNGTLRLRVVPTSLYSGEAGRAAQLLSTATPFAYLNELAHRSAQADTISTAAAKLAVASNNTKIQAAGFVGVPYQILAQVGQVGPSARWAGLYLYKLASLAKHPQWRLAVTAWPTDGWTESELATLSQRYKTDGADNLRVIAPGDINSAGYTPANTVNWTKEVCSKVGECWKAPDPANKTAAAVGETGGAAAGAGGGDPGVSRLGTLLGATGWPFRTKKTDE